MDIGIGRDALLHVREMGEGYVAKPEDVVQVGEKIETRVIELSRRRGRVDLSLKGLRPEPEPEPEPQDAEIEAVEDEETSSDPYEELEMLSPMELAFKSYGSRGYGDDGTGQEATETKSSAIRRVRYKMILYLGR